MLRFEKFLLFLAHGFNWVASAAIAAMMCLTTADVVLRLLRRPIPGTYEIVGFLGALAISFSLAYTSVEKGHIAVDLLVEKFSRRVQAGVQACNDFCGTFLFAMIAWQSAVYASNLKQSGEVSLTLQLPLYPFVYGIAVGCSLLCLYLVSTLVRSLKRMLPA